MGMEMIPRLLEALCHSRTDQPLYASRFALREVRVSSLRKVQTPHLQHLTHPSHPPSTFPALDGSWHRRQRDVDPQTFIPEKKAARVRLTVHREDPEIHSGLFPEEVDQFAQPSAVRYRNDQEDSCVNAIEEIIWQTWAGTHTATE